MDQLQRITERRSVRSYQEREISKEDAAKILEAAIQAPTAKNRQPLFYVLLTDRKKIDQIVKPLGIETNYYAAPAILFSFKRREDPLVDLDVGAAMMSAMLEAEELGISSCWIHSTVASLDTEEGREILKEVLELNDLYSPSETLALGYLKGEKPPKKERDYSDAKVL